MCDSSPNTRNYRRTQPRYKNNLFKLYTLVLWIMVFVYTQSRLKGQRGLEIRGNGAGQTVPVDLHVGRGGWYGGHHFAGAHSVR